MKQIMNEFNLDRKLDNMWDHLNADPKKSLKMIEHVINQTKNRVREEEVNRGWQGSGFAEVLRSVMWSDLWKKQMEKYETD